MTNPVGRLWGWFKRRPPIVRQLILVLTLVVAASIGYLVIPNLFDTSCATGVERTEDDAGDDHQGYKHPARYGD